MVLDGHGLLQEVSLTYDIKKASFVINQTRELVVPDLMDL
jgi:hypothetical protein